MPECDSFVAGEMLTNDILFDRIVCVVLMNRQQKLLRELV